MPAASPIIRIEQVARDLGRLAEEIERYIGPEARRTLLYWRGELLAALDELERHSAAVR
jgi:hypothetical protein